MRVNSIGISPSPGLTTDRKTDSLQPRKENTGPLDESAQREPAIRAGSCCGPLGPVARLEDLDIGQRPALAIDDPTAERAQWPLNQWQQDPRLLADRDPFRENWLEPRRRTATRYCDPTSRLSGVRNEPSAAVRTGPVVKPTGPGFSHMVFPLYQTSTVWPPTGLPEASGHDRPDGSSASAAR